MHKGTLLHEDTFEVITFFLFDLFFLYLLIFYITNTPSYPWQNFFSSYFFTIMLPLTLTLSL